MTVIGASESPHINLRERPHLTAFNTLSEDEVRKLVMKSRATTCLLDPVPMMLLTEHLEDILPLLTHLTNTSLTTGVFPSAWKTAIVKPLLKKDGLELFPKNYRPVSNFKFLCIV